MNANGATYMTTYQNQFLPGLIDHHSPAMITMPVQSKTCVKMVSAKELNIVVENPIRNPVVFKILGVLAMEPAQIS
jgi:hypothetical protein